MMTEVERIADQSRRAFVAEAWHGPAVLETLEGITATQAAARPIAGAHTIWELVLHLTGWKRVLVTRLRGQAMELTGEQDFPPSKDTSEAAWRAVLEDLKRAHEELQKAVEALPELRLNEQVPGRDYDVYFMLHGFSRHDAYHAGQIALLKKAAAGSR